MVEMVNMVCTLGCGVTVEESPAGEVLVTSRRLALPWMPQSAVLPGTAVMWRDTVWEARSVSFGDGGQRWRLSPWPESEIVRACDRLDGDRVGELAAEADEEERIRRVRNLLIAFLPVIGSLPRKIQVRLEWDYNVPAGLATVTSAVLEAASGFVLFFAIRSDAWAPPPGLGWVILLSPAMVLEGFVRLWSGLTVNEPFGSFVLAPLALFIRARRPTATNLEGFRPSVHRRDDETGELELITDEPRWDWVVGGVLRYREGVYRLVERSGLGGKSLFLFEPAADGSEVTLTLMPKPRRERVRAGGRGFGAEILRFMLVAFAPRRVQEVIVADMRLPLRLLTLASASLQAIGGAVNLYGASLADPMALFDIVLLGEGLARMLWSVIFGAPVGSVLGWPFRGLYSFWVEELEGSESTSARSGVPQNGQNRNPVSAGN